MLLADANDMIARNRASLEALQQIARRMKLETGEILNIAAHEKIVAGQQELSLFGRVFYFDGAASADALEELRHVRPAFRRQTAEVRFRTIQDFEGKCDRTINRLFPDMKRKEEAQ